MCKTAPLFGQDLSLQRILDEFVDELEFPEHVRKVLAQLVACGTGDLGHHYLRCSHCGRVEVVGRACQNRHCPNCNHTRTAEWCAAREAEMLPVPYQRYEFGLPSGLKRYAQRYPRVMYKLLISAAQDTVLELAKSPSSLGVVPAVMTALHTATSELHYFPHAHVEASAGGYDASQDRWVPASDGELIAPLDQAKDLFRDKVLAGLELRRRHGRFSDGGRPEIELLDAELWQAWVCGLREQRWPVSGGEPYGGGLQYLRYLSKSVYRVPIANRQLMSYRDGKVVFQFRDRKTQRNRTRRMDAESFVRLLAMHILPPGFHQVRFAGLWARPSRAKLEAAQAAALRAVGSGQQDPPDTQSWVPPQHLCEHCEQGELRLLLSTMPWGTVLGPAMLDLASRGPPNQQLLPLTSPA
jgi:hypothetical protein